MSQCPDSPIASTPHRCQGWGAIPPGVTTGNTAHHLNPTQMLNVRIYQQTIDGDTSIDSTTSIAFGSSTTSVKRQVGTICREIFHKMDLYKRVGSRYATCSAPLLITFKSKGKLLDLGSFEDELTCKLKPGYSPDARIRYATRVLTLTKEALSVADRLNETVEFDDLIAELEAAK